MKTYFFVFLVLVVLLPTVVATSITSTAHVFLYNESVGAITSTRDARTNVSMGTLGTVRIADLAPFNVTPGASQQNQSLFLPSATNTGINLSYAYFNGIRLNSTWETWWRVAGNTAFSHGIMSDRAGASGIVLYWSRTDNQFQCFWAPGGGGPQDTLNSSVYTLDNASWYHVACVINENWMTLVINGTNVSHIDFSSPRVDADYVFLQSSMNIGTYPGSAARSDAYFAHTRIWNSSRTAAQIASTMWEAIPNWSAAAPGGGTTGYLYPYDAENHKHTLKPTTGSYNDSWGNWHAVGNSLYAMPKGGTDGYGVSSNRWIDCSFGQVHWAEDTTLWGTTSTPNCESGSDYTNINRINETWYPHKMVQIANSTSGTFDMVTTTISGDDDVYAINFQLASGRNTSAYTRNFSLDFPTATTIKLMNATNYTSGGTPFPDLNYTCFNISASPGDTGDWQTGVTYWIVCPSLNYTYANETSSGGGSGHFEWASLAYPTNLTFIVMENSTYWFNRTRSAEWLTNFSNMTEQRREWFNNYVGGFKYPTNVTLNETVDRYYTDIVYYAMLNFKPPRGLRNMTSFRNPSGSANYSLMFIVPTPRDYFGMWIWDTGTADLGLLAAINRTDPKSSVGLRFVEDHLTIQQATQNTSFGTTTRTGNAVFSWYQHIHLGSVETGSTQPMGLWEPVNWNFNYGVRNNTNQLCGLYPILKAHYQQKVSGSDATLLCKFSTGVDSGRDGSVFSAAQYWVDCSAFMQSSNYFLNKTGTICNDTTTQYQTDFLTRRSSINSYLWKDDLTNGGGVRHGGYTQLTAGLAIYTNASDGTPAHTGNMGLVLWTPTPNSTANITDLYTTFISNLFAYPGSSNWPSSLTTNSSNYNPTNQWNGPVWSFDLAHDALGFLGQHQDNAYLAMQARYDFYRSQNALSWEGVDGITGIPTSSWSKRPNAPGVGASMILYSGFDVLGSAGSVDSNSTQPPSMANRTSNVSNWTAYIGWDNTLEANVSLRSFKPAGDQQNRSNWSLGWRNVTFNVTLTNLTPSTTYTFYAVLCNNNESIGLSGLCTNTSFTVTTSATSNGVTNSTRRYPGYENMTHPYLFQGQEMQKTLASRLNGSQSVYKPIADDWNYTLQNQTATLTTCRATGNPPGSTSLMWHTAFKAYVLNDLDLMNVSLDCLRYWTTNYTNFTTTDFHSRMVMYVGIGLTYDVLRNNMTKAFQNLIVQGIENNLTNIDVIVENESASYTNASQLDAENGRFLRCGPTVLCMATLGDSNFSEQQCGDDEQDWMANNYWGIKSHANATNGGLALDGSVAYLQYGQKSCWGAAYLLHDRMAAEVVANTSQRFNFTAYNVSFQSIGGEAMPLLYYLEDAKYDGKVEWSYSNSSFFRSLTLGDSAIYQEMDSDSLMGMMAYARPNLRSFLWYYLNESTRSGTKYDLTSVSGGNNENRFLTELWAYDPATVNVTPYWTQQRLNVTQVWRQGLAVYKGTILQNPSSPSGLYFAHKVPDQNGGHGDAEANDITINYNGEVCLQDMGESLNDTYRGEGYNNGLRLERQNGGSRFKDYAQEEPQQAYQRYGLRLSTSEHQTDPNNPTLRSQALMQHVPGATNNPTDADYPNITWANRTQRGWPDAFMGSPGGLGFTYTGYAAYNKLSNGWVRTSVVFPSHDGPYIFLADTVWHNGNPRLEMDWVYITPGVFNYLVGNGSAGTFVSASMTCNATKLYMEWTTPNYNATLSIINDHSLPYRWFHSGDSGTAVGDSSFKSVNGTRMIYRAKNDSETNSTLNPSNWSMATVIVPKTTADAAPSIAIINETLEQGMTVTGTHAVTYVRPADGIVGTLNVSRNPGVWDLWTNAYALTVEQNSTAVTLWAVTNTTFVLNGSDNFLTSGAHLSAAWNQTDPRHPSLAYRTYTTTDWINLSFAGVLSNNYTINATLDGVSLVLVNSSNDTTVAWQTSPDDDHLVLFSIADAENTSISGGGGGSSSNVTGADCGAQNRAGIMQFFLNVARHTGVSFGIFGTLIGAFIVLWIVFFRDDAFPWPVIVVLVGVFIVILISSSVAAGIVNALCSS